MRMPELDPGRAERATDRTAKAILRLELKLRQEQLAATVSGRLAHHDPDHPHAQAFRFDGVAIRGARTALMDALVGWIVSGADPEAELRRQAASMASGSTTDLSIEALAPRCSAVLLDTAWRLALVLAEGSDPGPGTRPGGGS